MIDIGGLVPLTTIDFPGKLAAVVFCRGCNWNCPYCHNKHLRERRKPKDFSWESILNFFKMRRGWLDAVVFSGGEPIIQKGLEECIKDVQELGLKIGLHTSGCSSEKFKPLLPYLDWVGFDLKGPLNEKYDLISGISGSYKEVLKSLNLLMESGIKHELRLTWDKEILNEEDILYTKGQLKSLGIESPLRIGLANKVKIPNK